VVSKVRIQRIADRIREELSEMMIHEVHDPRLVGVTITDITVDRELAYADVYVSSLEGSERASEVIPALEHAGGFLRTELARRVELRIFPKLRFHWDPTPERADHMEILFKAMQAEAEASSKQPSSDQPKEGDQNG
jgi:ribosome-binding factor A